MAYAALRNALGDREFVAARLGHISDETALVLKRFGFEPPVRIQTMPFPASDGDGVRGRKRRTGRRPR